MPFMWNPSKNNNFHWLAVLHFSSTQCCCQCKCKDLDPTFLCFRTCASELKFQRQPDQNFRKYLSVAATIFILLSAIQVGISCNLNHSNLPTTKSFLGVWSGKAYKLFSVITCTFLKADSPGSLHNRLCYSSFPYHGMDFCWKWRSGK